MTQVVQNLRQGRDVKRWLCAAVMHADGRPFPEVTKLVLETRDSEVKHQALVALYVMDRKAARPIFFDVAAHKSSLPVGHAQRCDGRSPVDRGHGGDRLYGGRVRLEEFLLVLIHLRCTIPRPGLAGGRGTA